MALSMVFARSDMRGFPVNIREGSTPFARDFHTGSFRYAGRLETYVWGQA